MKPSATVKMDLKAVGSCCGPRIREEAREKWWKRVGGGGGGGAGTRENLRKSPETLGNLSSARLNAWEDEEVSRSQQNRARTCEVT